MLKGKTKLEWTGFTLVLLMVLLQSFYAVYAYVDYGSFAVLRGTDLVSIVDKDWVQIYASRTLFVALIIGYLLLVKNYRALVIASIFGVVMPITDGALAYASDAPAAVVLKHVIIVVYLLLTAFVLQAIIKQKSR
jgi:hypothetical protein